MNPDEFAEDVNTTVGVLLDSIDLSNSDAAEMGMDPKQLAGMFQMKLRQYSNEHPEKMLTTTAVIHQATKDILDKYSDKPPQELAGEVFK